MLEYSTVPGSAPADDHASAGEHVPVAEQDPSVNEPAPPSDGLQLDSAKASRNLRQGMLTVGILVVLVIGLLLAVPGLHGVARKVTQMPAGLVVIAVVFELLSCTAYIIAFLQVFDRAPIRFGARVALSELAFGSAVPLGGAGSVALGALLLVERGGSPRRVAERSAILFLLTSGVNVITLAVAGLGAWTGLLPSRGGLLLTLVPGAVGTVTMIVFLALPRISERWVSPTSGRRLAVATRAAADTVRRTSKILFSRDWRLIGAFGFLWFDIAVLAICFWAIGTVPPLSTLVLAYQIGYLSNLLPVPGGIGVLDGSFIGLFALYGISATTATAATLVYHAISLLVPAVWGTLAFLLLRRTRGQPLILRPPRSERRGA
jgi:uncharacterized membrane protein YbhN (UPF0104 family)